ncbi:unnamed protein product [Ilex paraguariensis]|uniref:Uncharacterized protein n=1 Tax=Ilex paraguariensis TaxID=185542 RepID=A0ABC8TN07_9AQUA
MLGQEGGESGKERTTEMNEREGAKEEREGLSLDEISKYRATAQQNSMEAIRAAEEKYAKNKESSESALRNEKESEGRSLGAGTGRGAEKVAHAKD